MRRLLSTIIAALTLALPTSVFAHMRLRSERYIAEPARPAQIITIANYGRIRQSVLRPIERAVAYEANHALRHWWRTPKIRFGRGGWRVVISQRPPDPNDLGIHGVDAAGDPYAIVSGTAPSRGVATSHDIGVTLAHEIFEMLVNPTADAQRDGWMLEIVDPVVDDMYFVRLPGLPANVDYVGLGVHTAQFVTPNWFVAHSRRPWDIDTVTEGPGDYSYGFAIYDGQLVIPGGLGQF